MRDLKSTLADLLGPLVAETTAEGPDRLLSLACRIEEFAAEVRNARKSTIERREFTCHGPCGKHFAVHLTVADWRNVDPDLCPLCWEKTEGAAGQMSALRPVTKYLD